MASVTVLRRADGKAHSTSVLDSDQIYAQGLILGAPGSAATAAALYDDSTTQTLTVGAGSAVTTITMGGGAAMTTGNIFNGSAMTTLGIGTGMQAGDTITLGGTGSTVTVSGDLVVSGTTTSVDSEVVNIADNHLYLNSGYTTTTAQTGGLVVNYDPDPATAQTTVAASGFESSATAGVNGEVHVAATTGFATGQIIQVSGANTDANNGLYEVLGTLTTPTRLSIRGTGTATVEDFTQTDFTDDATAAGTITLVNVAVMRAGTDGIWETANGSTTPLSFADIGSGAGNSLQQAYVVGNTITTSAAEGDFDVSGTEAISLDASAASNFTVAGANLSLGTTTSGDVLISTVTAGEIDITSAGLLDINPGANMDIDVTGTYDMLASSTFSISGTGASTVNATSGTLTLSTTTTGDVSIDSVDSVTIDGAEAAADAVRIFASNAGGGIDIDAGTAGIDILTTGAFSIDGTGASNVTADTGTLTLSTTTSGDVSIDSVDSVTIDGAEAAADAVRIFASNAAGGIDVDAGTAGVTVDATGGISLDATNTTASNFTSANTTAATNTTFTITVDNTGATSGDATLDINATSTNGSGIIDIDADDTINADVAAGGSIGINTGGSNGTVSIGSATGGAVAVDSAGTISLDGVGASNFTTDTGNLTLSTTTSGNVVLNSAGDIDADAANFLVDATAGISLDAAADSNYTVTNTVATTNVTSTITVANTGATSGDATLDINATSTNGSGLIDIDADDDITVDSAAGAISLDSVTASNFTVSGATADLTLGARGATVTLNEADFTLGGETIEGQTLDAAFTASSIVGALNELKTAGVDEADQVVGDYITTGLTIGNPVYINTTDDTAAATDATVLATSEAFIGIAKTIGALGTGEVVTSGTVPALVEAGLTGADYPVAGDPLYLSETSGRVTTVAPTGNPNSGIVVYRIGFVKNDTGLTATTTGASDLVNMELRPGQFVEL